MGIAPQPFTYNVSDEALADLRSRLSATRLPDQAPGEAWAYGTEVSYLRDLIDYWRTTFDWRAQEAALNAFPQFKVPLHDINIHFLHVAGKQTNPIPLLLLHGWPGSVFEFLDIIPRLTDPARFGGDPADAFTIVAPSLPGYGLSFQPGQKRFAIPDIAACVADLMTEVLGYQRYAAQGGDWGLRFRLVWGGRMPAHWLAFIPICWRYAATFRRLRSRHRMSSDFSMRWVSGPERGAAMA